MAVSPTQVSSQLIAAGQYGDVASQLDVMELQTTDLDQWPHTLQLLGHMYNGDIEDARFAWKRASDTHKQSSELKAALAVLQQLWNKNYQGVWPALTSFQWSESASPLVLAIATRQRQHAIQLVSCAYSSIQPARLAALTGSTPDEALQSKHA
ncbi:COP9 signalosome complex subunit 8 [Trebouxia sp. C0010 RCD-2024]